MKYEVGQVFLWNTYDGIFVKLIHLYNKIHYGNWGYTHASIIGEIKDGKVIMYETTAVGYTKNEYDPLWLDEAQKTGEIKVRYPKYALKGLKEICESYIGRPYGFLDIFHIALSLILGERAFRLSNTSKQLICSEAVARSLYEASKHKIDLSEEFDKSFDLITPNDVSLSTKLEDA
jgi:hypothetical protein